ncbi:tRNA (adenosine(37)-N6)-dimethylallyltransferase MiaA [Lichenicola cladoniae]|nr:tRNA (adenosine(37)-N6)-dimethylallyltransferase MiaA [Lichenicola cladoniae]
MQPLAANHCLIVAGPTCSGKSALALRLAQVMGGNVINADSMQVYHELRTLTARPTPDEEALAPHALYGIRPAAMPGSVAWWRAAALGAMQEAWNAGRLPILCGGTGLYLRAMTDGLSLIPDAGDTARREARALLDEIGPSALHQRLALVDPDSARMLRPSDGQRLARAWEVWSGTGRGIAEWRVSPGLPPAPCRFIAIRLDPPRDVLRAAIEARFGRMIETGALDEVAALLEQDLPPTLPAMRAHGVPELAACLRGELGLAEAGRRAVLSQGQYTKRQATWFAHHALAPSERTLIISNRISVMTQQMERTDDEFISFVLNAVDAQAAGA